MNQQEAIDIMLRVDSECEKHPGCKDCPFYLADIDEPICSLANLDKPIVKYLKEKNGKCSDESFSEFVLEKLQELAELFKKKNDQYGEHDPLANFRAGASLHGKADYAAMFEEAKGYCRKHIAQVYGPKQTIDTPKVEESLQDIAVYSVIMLYMHKMENNVQ